jgi:hypothetical protein
MTNWLKATLATMAIGLMACEMRIAAAQDAAPTPAPIPGYVENGPPLGIIGQPFSMKIPDGVIRGVAVNRDTAARTLYRDDSRGRRRAYRFRSRYDVILTVNRRPVRSPSEVLQNTEWGWNDLRIWDRATGETATYQIWLD